jgi:hypothetical protein
VRGIRRRAQGFAHLRSRYSTVLGARAPVLFVREDGGTHHAAVVELVDKPSERAADHRASFHLVKEDILAAIAYAADVIAREDVLVVSEIG